VDRELLLGSAVFGVGWGMAAFCPGQAVIVIASGKVIAFALAGAMLVGMDLESAVERRLVRHAPEPSCAPAVKA
jgi:uncharacterized membrane protein YedE/YeeE